MLGKTNLLFVAEDEPTDLSFNPQYILTSSSGNILKIEYINNLFFVFANDNKVLYGSDINNLQTLKKDGSPFPATYIIYKNNAYYMITKEESNEKVVVYKTTNLTSFEEILIRSISSEVDSDLTVYNAGALLLTSDNRIAMLYSKVRENVPRMRFILTDSFDGFNHESNNFIEFNEYMGYDFYKTYMLKDRIFSYYSSNSLYLITLDGTLKNVTQFTNYAAGYFFYVSTYTTSNMSSSRKLVVYYSLNGVDYQAVQLDIPAYNTSTMKGVSFFEYDGNIAMLYPDENDEMKQKIAISPTPKGLVDAVKTAIPVSVDYSIQTKISLYKDDYVYLGSTGGIIIKAKLDYTDTARPDITVLKTLSAKQALVESKRYTDEKIAALEAKVKALEEA